MVITVNISLLLEVIEDVVSINLEHSLIAVFKIIEIVFILVLWGLTVDVLIVKVDLIGKVVQGTALY